MADDAGRRSEILAETSFLYGNAGFVEDLQAKWAGDPNAVEPSWADFFASLADSPEAVRHAKAPPAWAPTAEPTPRPDWLPAIDGLCARS
jgi:2-oxoglutarate dehydrogenase E1 component